MWRTIGGLANCFLRSPTLRERASRSQAAVSVGEAGEHVLVGQVVVAKWLTENVALPRREEQQRANVCRAAFDERSCSVLFP